MHEQEQGDEIWQSSKPRVVKLNLKVASLLGKRETASSLKTGSYILEEGVMLT